jgi:hypothetical protein
LILSLFSVKSDQFTVSPYENEFVSAFQDSHKTLSSLTLYGVRRVFDLDSLSTDEELHLDGTVTHDNVHSNSRLRDRTKQLAQLTRLLRAGLPQLQEVSLVFLKMARGISTMTEPSIGSFRSRATVG